MLSAMRISFTDFLLILGAKILKRVAGKDATKQFWKYHNESVLKKYSERLRIGSVGEKAKL